MVVFVSLASLWLPILLSAVFVFIVSSVMHMFLPYHKSDYRKLPDEGKVMEALRSAKAAKAKTMAAAAMVRCMLQIPRSAFPESVAPVPTPAGTAPRARRAADSPVV